MCTFCGFRVALSGRERSETRDMRPADGAAAAAAGAAAGAAKGSSWILVALSRRT